MKHQGKLLIDYTHVGRRKTGIERISAELFSSATLSLPMRLFRARSDRISVFVAQMFLLPLYAIFHPRDVVLFPGFPPSPLAKMISDRCVIYIHDLFLLTRTDDLNLAGKLYLAPLFAFAVKRFKYFFANSEATAVALRKFIPKEGQVFSYRPSIRNVFSLAVGDRTARSVAPSTLRLVALGTVEPRKNLVAAAEICRALAKARGGMVELHVIGRRGWGDDWIDLSRRTDVTLYAVLPDNEVRKVVEAADIYICTSHDEGLGLPLLEVQFAGIMTVAPDRDVFREVLGKSGTYIDTRNPDRAAAIILQACADNDWRRRHAASAEKNLIRWNKLAKMDRLHAEAFLRSMLNRTRAS